MKNKKKIILFEGELDKPKGHHYDQLVENSIYYKNKGDIIWLVNKNFDSLNYYVPEHVKVFKCIFSSNRKIDRRNLFFIISIILKNFIIIISLILKFNFISINLIKNIFSIPRYFPSFLKFINLVKLNDEDIFIFQTSRINEFELGSFMYQNRITPVLHFRIMQLNKKKKLLKFCSILKRFQKNNYLNKTIFVYSENNFQKKIIKQLTNIDVEIFSNNLTFSSRDFKTKIFTLGFLGETRIEKGFERLPDIIEKLNITVKKQFNFFIQISSCPKELQIIKKKLFFLKEKYTNIIIRENYIDFFEYKEILKNIDIIPILHTDDQLKFNGSGIVFSAIANEIPLVIPKESKFVKQFLKNGTYLEASTNDEYVEKIRHIIFNYNEFLIEAKKQSKIFKDKIAKDPINLRV